MNILIVTAHPSPYGYTHKIAEAYKENRKAKGHNVELVNLYAKEYRTPLLEYESLEDYKISTLQKKFQNQLLSAHEIVVVHPVWWGMPPSIMKSWVELTFWPHIAYAYKEDGKVSKLLEGKSAKVFATSGGPAWIYKTFLFPLKPFWKASVFEFCGADLVDIRICGNLDKWKDERRDKLFDKFLKAIKKIK